MNANSTNRTAADEISAGLDRMAMTAPTGMQNFQALLRNAWSTSIGSPAQAIALIGMAMAVAQRCDNCIERQIRRAVSTRIDRIHVVAALKRAVLMADGPAMAYGAHALAQFDHLAACAKGDALLPKEDDLSPTEYVPSASRRFPAPRQAVG